MQSSEFDGVLKSSMKNPTHGKVPPEASESKVQVTADIVNANMNFSGTPNMHVTYDIVTTASQPEGFPRQYRISRRFSHFVTLEEELNKVRAAVGNQGTKFSPPSLPSKTLTRKHSTQFIEQRRVKLVDYLQGVVNLRTSQTESLIYSFLGANELSSIDSYAVDSWMTRTGSLTFRSSTIVFYQHF